jgi:hypothetical protein
MAGGGIGGEIMKTNIREKKYSSKIEYKKSADMW